MRYDLAAEMITRLGFMMEMIAWVGVAIELITPFCSAFLE